MPNTRRTFISIEVPQSVKQRIGEFARLIPDLQPHPSDNFHVTVKFVGDVDDAQLAKMQHALADIAVDVPQFSIGFKGLKFEESRLRFLVRNPEAIMTLRNDVEQGLRKLGIAHEDPLLYEPHITLGKIKTAPVREPSFDYASLAFNVDRVVLFETLRGERTAQFIPLKEFMLW